MAKKIGWVALWLSIVVSSSATDLLTSAEHVFYRPDQTRVGIEIEYSGLDLKDSADAVLKHVGGTLLIKNVTHSTTLKEILPNGTRVYNQVTVPEYIIKNSSIGQVVLKPDFNQLDDSQINLKNYVVEMVTEPLFAEHIPFLQKIMDELKSRGALGTSPTRTVATQMNTEIASGQIEKLDWQMVVNILRVYSRLPHRAQISKKLNVPSNRQKYLLPLSPGFLKKLLEPTYQPTGRELYDDLIYRQSLELLGETRAWEMPIEEAHRLLLAKPNPIVPRVVKLNRLRLSSLLMWAFPQDPMSKIYAQSGWAVARPLIEWREWNTDFDITSPYRQALGIINAAKEHGYFDHDLLMAELSGVESKVIRKLREKDSSVKDPNIFRYFLGDSRKMKRSDIEAYSGMKEAYEKTVVGFLPLYEIGLKPLVVPGESVVFHRLPMHRHSVLGKYNPTLINTNIVQALENKYVEFKFWDGYAPSSMPKTVLFRDFNLSQPDPDTIQAVLDKNFPTGWVLKGVWDLGSEKTIVTDQTQIAKHLRDYKRSNFEEYKSNIERELRDLNDAPEYLLSKLKKHPAYLGWKIANLLNNPDLAIVQQRVEIDREFRVEIVAGQVLGGESTLDRFAYEYKYKINSGKYVAPARWMFKVAEEFAQKTVDQLPVEFRNMSFGMDVAILKSGQPTMIESNPGGNSNFLFEEEEPSVQLLRRFLDGIPQAVNAKKINLGLSPAEQMQFLERKFREWNVRAEEQFPGIRFTETEMVDPEFKTRTVDPKKFQISSKNSFRKCVGLF